MAAHRWRRSTVVVAAIVAGVLPAAGARASEDLVDQGALQWSTPVAASVPGETCADWPDVNRSVPDILTTTAEVGWTDTTAPRAGEHYWLRIRTTVHTEVCGGEVVEHRMALPASTVVDGAGVECWYRETPDSTPVEVTDDVEFHCPTSPSIGADGAWDLGFRSLYHDWEFTMLVPVVSYGTLDGDPAVVTTDGSVHTTGDAAVGVPLTVRTGPALTYDASPGPGIAGSPKPGNKLRVAHLSAAGFTPDATRLSYQWRADGKPLAGETRASLAVTKRLLGKKVTVAITAARPGYRSGQLTTPGIRVRR